MKDPELDWIQNATGRLATLYGVERLNEELLCFASWLSLNRYEEDALRKVKTVGKRWWNELSCPSHSRSSEVRSAACLYLI